MSHQKIYLSHSHFVSGEVHMNMSLCQPRHCI